MTDSTIDKIVNVRAMHRLRTTFKKTKSFQIPKLDDVLDEFINEEMERCGASGDDVEIADELEDTASEDDEDYTLLDDEDDEDMSHMQVNSSLDNSLYC